MSDLNYVLTGKDSGPPVLFLHGFMGSVHDWRQTVSAIEGTVQCLRVDLPGHGASLHFQDDYFYTMPGACEAVLACLDALDISTCHIVGYSMGGRLALYLALHHPSRCHRLVLESAAPGLTTPSDRRERRKIDEERAERITKDFGAFLEHWYRQPLFQSLSQHGLVEEMIQSRLHNDPAELARSIRGMSPGRQPPHDELLVNLQPHALAMTGALDPKYPALARRIAAVSANLNARVVNDAGHNVHAEQPSAFVDVIRAFLCPTD